MTVHVLQAEKASWNSIGIFKVSNIFGKRRELVPKVEGDESGMDDEDSDSEADSEDEDEAGAKGPTLQATSSSFELFMSLLGCFRFDLANIVILFTTAVAEGNS